MYGCIASGHHLIVSKISSTSAFAALLFDGESHTSPMARRYTKLLDLDAGRSLVERCRDFWPYYSEVIKNRKACIHGMANDAVRRDGIRQAVIFGAGFDALSLEISTWADDCSIYEIDVANMDAKSEIIRALDPSLAGRIKCIATDVSDVDGTMQALAERGWDPGAPSLAVFEGISYYLQDAVLWDVVGRFAPGDGSDRVILEYLLPNAEIRADRIPIAEYPFRLITNESGIGDAVRYDIKGITSRVGELGGSVLQHRSMREMERQRRSRNAIFESDRSWWVEVCELAV